QLPGQVEPEAGSLFMGGKEGLEDLRTLFQRYARTIVDDIERNFTVAADRADPQGDDRLPVLRAGVPERVFHQVPDSLAELAGVDQYHDRGRGQLDLHSAGIELVVLTEISGQFSQPADQIDRVDACPLPA